MGKIGISQRLADEKDLYPSQVALAIQVYKNTVRNLYGPGHFPFVQVNIHGIRVAVIRDFHLSLPLSVKHYRNHLDLFWQGQVDNLYPSLAKLFGGNDFVIITMPPVIRREYHSFHLFL
jgi:hypothetical protein